MTACLLHVTKPLRRFSAGAVLLQMLTELSPSHGDGQWSRLLEPAALPVAQVRQAPRRPRGWANSSCL